MSPLATYLVETFVTLLAVIAVAVVVLMGAKRLGLGRPHGPMNLVGRMPLDARRVVYLVRVADQVLILGASETGLTKLGQLDRQQVENAATEPVQPAFPDLLARIRGQAPDNPAFQRTKPEENQHDA